MKLVYCTAIFGNTDPLKPPLDVNREAQYICFSDRPQPDHGAWEVRVVDCWHHPRLQARLYKIRPELFFPDADVFAWIDGSFQIVRDPTDVIVRNAKNHDVLCFKHPHRTRVEDEAVAVNKHCGIPLALAQTQVKYYRDQGWTRDDAISSTGFFVRRNTQKIRDWQRDWWEEICMWSIRDQLSVDFTMWKHKITVGYFQGHYRNNKWVKFHKHNSNSPAPKLRWSRGLDPNEKRLK